MQCVYATPAFWNGTNGTNPTVYIAVESRPVMALQLSNGLIPQSAQVAIAASQSGETYSYPSPTPTVSAAGSSSGAAIVWVLDNDANGTDNGSTALGPAILRAYDANNLGTTLYSSDRLGTDTGGNAAKFTLPVVANGHVYVGGDNVLTVYGLVPYGSLRRCSAAHPSRAILPNCAARLIARRNDISRQRSDLRSSL